MSFIKKYRVQILFVLTLLILVTFILILTTFGAVYRGTNNGYEIAMEFSGSLLIFGGNGTVKASSGSQSATTDFVSLAGVSAHLSPLALISFILYFPIFGFACYILYCSFKKKAVHKAVSPILLILSAFASGFIFSSGANFFEMNKSVFSSQVTLVADTGWIIAGILLLLSCIAVMIIDRYVKVEEEKPMRQEESIVITSPSTELEKVEALKKYKELVDQGVITQEEFDKKKKEIL